VTRAGPAVGLACWVTVAAGHAAAAPAEPAATSASSRASVVWIYGDDDVLHAPAETRPASPAAGVGDRPGYDGLAAGLSSRYTGRESELRLGWAARAPGFVSRLTTHADLALALDVDAMGGKPAPMLVEDLGSSLHAALSLTPREQGPVLEFRLYPFNADVERVGWLEILAWGGQVGLTRESPYRNAVGAVRGGTLALDTGALRLLVGMKTANFLEPMPVGPTAVETSYGAFGRLEVRVGTSLTLGLGGGRFEHGRLEGRARTPARSTTTGASARVGFAFGVGEALAPPSFGADLPAPEHQAARRSGFAVALEATTLLERLVDIDEPSRDVPAPARGAALVGTVGLHPFELRAALVMRDPLFVMRQVPGVYPGYTIPSSAVTADDWMAIVSGAYRGSPRFVPVLAIGVRTPAAVMTESRDAFGQPSGAALVLYSPTDVEMLPPGHAPVPVLETRGSCDVRLSALLTAIGWVEYRRDFNRTRLAPDEASGVIGRGFLAPDRLGYGLAARAFF